MTHYPVRGVTDLERIRRRVPLVVFVLLLVMVVLAIGFACACFGDPLKASDRTSGAPFSMPALVEMWAAIVLALVVIPLLLARRISPASRASPAVLQCFLR